MAHTNSTTNYSLPQFLPTDKPAWLTDVNGAFSDIDTAVHNAQTKANDAYTNAGTAQSDATTAITNAAAADAKGSGALASIEAAFDPTTIYSVGAKVIYNNLLYRCIVAVVTPGPWTGSDNWERINVDTLISTVDSKVGNLTSLSTTDKNNTVSAINEVNGKTEWTAVTGITTYNLTDPIVTAVKNGMFCIVTIEGIPTSTSNNITYVSGLPEVKSGFDLRTSLPMINGRNIPVRLKSSGGSSYIETYFTDTTGTNSRFEATIIYPI